MFPKSFFAEVIAKHTAIALYFQNEYVLKIHSREYTVRCVCYCCWLWLSDVASSHPKIDCVCGMNLKAHCEPTKEFKMPDPLNTVDYGVYLLRLSRLLLLLLLVFLSNGIVYYNIFGAWRSCAFTRKQPNASIYNTKMKKKRQASNHCRTQHGILESLAFSFGALSLHLMHKR